MTAAFDKYIEKCQECRKLRAEVERLTAENKRLEDELKRTLGYFARPKTRTLKTPMTDETKEHTALATIMSLADEISGYAKANADAASTDDERNTWLAHHRNCILLRAALVELEQ